ncbi:MAG: cob(I)yrinic acid a,c-diamide adenosyltransferase [Candidatus Woesebacteria bacterium]|jgi:cob(I)alamin adenosyltransferase
MINISTKGGDDGKSALANGERRAKDDLIFEVIGNLDELNSWLGLLLTKLGSNFKEEQKFLIYLQKEFFVLGAELAQSPKAKLSITVLNKLEKNSEDLQKRMKENWHQRFLLPGGTELAVFLDIARTVARRFERSLIALSKKETIRPLILKIANRLSDYLYVLRCFVNWSLNYSEKKFKSN